MRTIGKILKGTGMRILVILAVITVFELVGLTNYNEYITTKMGMKILIENELENILIIVFAGNCIYNCGNRLFKFISKKKLEKQTEKEK